MPKHLKHEHEIFIAKQEYCVWNKILHERKLFKSYVKKDKKGMPTCSVISERKRSLFEGMSVSDAELRVPNDKLLLRFVLEESNLSESNEAEFTLRDDVKAFLEGRVDPKRKTL